LHSLAIVFEIQASFLLAGDVSLGWCYGVRLVPEANLQMQDGKTKHDSTCGALNYCNQNIREAIPQTAYGTDNLHKI